MKPTRRSGREPVVVEREQHALRPGLDLGDARALAQLLDPDQLQQLLGLGGQRAKRSISSAANASMSSGDSARRGGICQAQIEIADVTLRNQGGGVDRDLRRPVFRLFGYAARPSLRASITASSRWLYSSKPTSLMWPDCSSPSRLPAPDVQVVRGQLEAGAQLVQALDDVQPLGGLAQLLLGRQGEVGVAAPCRGRSARAAGTAATGRSGQAVHDQGIGGGHIQPGSR